MEIKKILLITVIALTNNITILSRQDSDVISDLRGFATGVFREPQPGEQQSFTTLFTRSLVGSLAGTVGISNPEEIGKLIPLTEFFINMPKVFPKAIQENDYGDREFNIAYRKPIDDEEGTREEVITISYDLQDSEAGAIDEPVGYELINGKYYFRPSEALMTREITGVKGSVDYIDLTNPEFQGMLLQALKLFPMGKDVYQAASRFFFLYPSDMFILRLLTLITSAYNNSNTGSGYPRFAHLPIELSMLFQRLSITPDLRGTMKAHGNVTPTPDWDPSRIVFFDKGPASLMQKLPSAFQNLVNIIKLTVNEEELQEMADRKGKGPSEVQKLLSQMRQTPGYKARTAFFKNNFLRIKFHNLNLSDQKLFIAALKQHIAERYTGLGKFIDEFISNFPILTKPNLDTVPVDISKITSTLESRTKEILEITEEAIIYLNSALDYKNIGKIELIDTLEAEIKQLEDLTRDIVREVPIETEGHSINMDSFQDNSLIGMSKEMSGTYLQALQSTKSMQERINFLEETINVAKNFSDAIGTLQADAYKNSQPIESSGTTLLNLEDYLNLRYYQFQNQSNMRFRGDTDFLYDDSPVSINQSITQAIAILLRASRDIAIGTELFKNDQQTYLMKDIGDNRIVEVTGYEIYEKYLGNSEQSKIIAEQTVDKIKKQSDAAAINADLDKALGQVEELQTHLSILNYNFLHYLKQYKFDRRIKEPLSRVKESQDKISIFSPIQKISKSEIIKKEKRKEIEEVLINNGIFGTYAIERLAIVAAKKYIAKMKEMLNIPNYIEIKMKARDSHRIQIENAEEALRNLEGKK